MTQFGTHAVEGTDTRTVRALTEPLAVDEHDPDVADHEVRVWSGETAYTVRPAAKACDCEDSLHRRPDGGCKHYRRFLFATGRRDLPAWVDDTDALDRTLATRLGLTDEDHDDTDGAESRATPTADAPSGSPVVATDGGTVTADAAGESTETPTYTTHREPLAQGGERYDRCEACGAELLCALGGREKLVHADGCPHANRDGGRR